MVKDSPGRGSRSFIHGNFYSCAKGLFLAKPLLNSERRLPILPLTPGLAKLRAFRAHLGLAVREAFPMQRPSKAASNYRQKMLLSTGRPFLFAIHLIIESQLLLLLTQNAKGC